ncbi:MAG: hypothetical protein MUC85_03315 [Anaerolineales bacterium]|jgi:chromosome segregation ATPase|nr:hypothetical protein [Anaerolineales bacterium]
MEPNALQQALDKLKATVNHLISDSPDQAVDPTERVKQSKKLEKQLQALRKEIDTLSAEQRKSLARLWHSIKTDLSFLKSEDGEPIRPRHELLARVRQVNEQTFALAKSCALKQEDQQKLSAQAQALHDQLTTLASELDFAAPEVTQLLAEAKLEVLFVLDEGNPPASLRIQDLLRAGS